MSPRASYLAGDMPESFAGLKEDKRHIFTRFEEAILKATEKYDMFLQTIGSMVMINLCSVEALDEFKNALPHSIDRADSTKYSLGKCFQESFLFLRSSEHQHKRRKYAMSKIGIQQVSKKIPLILKSLEQRFSTVKEGDRIDISTALDEVSMCVITKTLFGEDAEDQAYFVNYERLNGTTVQLSLFEALRDIQHDTCQVGLSPWNIIFQFIPKYNIGTQNRRLARNIA